MLTRRSLLSLLWWFVVDDLLRDLSEAGYKAVCYEDDIAIIGSGKFAEPCRKRWQELSVNPEKTTLVPFINRKTLLIKNVSFYRTTPRANGEGEIFGSDSRPHLEHITKRAIRILWACRRNDLSIICKVDWNKHTGMQQYSG